MIRLNRPDRAPRTLRGRGAAATEAMLVAFSAEPDAYRQGMKKFDFDSGIYGATPVKEALKGFHHDKCAFCEAKVSHVAHGDVEHFRPKGAVADENGAKRFPGYFWLAYRWENLFFACQLCNQSFKRSLFPLAGSVEHALPSAEGAEPDLRSEPALFVDPASEDPALHIGFHEYSPMALTERGAATIGGLGLDRDMLEEQRMSHLAPWKRLQEVVKLFPPNSDIALQAQRELDRARDEAIGDRAEYAAMMRAFFAAQPLP